MKKSCLFIFAVFIVALVSCHKENPNAGGVVTPPEIDAVSGVSLTYETTQFSTLKITPKVKFSKGEEKDIKYEWSVDYKIVSTEKNLNLKLTKTGTFDGYFKASSETSAILVKFKLRVASPAFDQGILLLSEAEGRPMLTFKNVVKMEDKSIVDFFSELNPGVVLGKKPVNIYWKGDTHTWPGSPTTSSKDLEAIVITDDPVKVYTMNYDDMKVRDEIVYDGEGEFKPETVLMPHGRQNSLWNGMELFFAGKGKFYCMTESKNFIKVPYEIPADAVIAPYICSGYSQMTMMASAIYDNFNKKMLYLDSDGETIVEGDKYCGVKAMALFSCGAEYRAPKDDYRHEPYKFMLIGSNGDQIKVLLFDVFWPSVEGAESFINEFDMSGKIMPNSTLCVNPARPVLYYSVGNKIFSMNYDSGNVDANPVVSLKDNMEVKSIAFDVYNPYRMFVAADDKNEKGELKAAIYVFDVTNATKPATQMFAEEHVGGSVKKLIYKGNGLECNYQGKNPYKKD